MPSGYNCILYITNTVQKSNKNNFRQLAPKYTSLSYFNVICFYCRPMPVEWKVSNSATYMLLMLGSELHASPHIHIWIGNNHIWIYMDKTIWECALYVG